MAKRSIGNTTPLSVVAKDPEEPENAAPDVSTEDDNKDAAERVSVSDDIAARLGELKAQVRTLKTSMAAAQKAVTATVSNTANVASENSRLAVRTYPISSIVLAGLVGVIVGRLSTSNRTPVYEGAFDELRNSLTTLATELPPQIKASLRSSLR
jgi:ElaB/YqjD/DUF883 family membrane-anchored ribosome-binding protein